MIARTITSADLSEVTGYTRHQLRGLLNELPGYQAKAARARVARAYTRHDLAVITVCCELERQYGLRRDAIAAVGQQLAGALLGPRAVATDAHLSITIVPPSVQYVEHLPVGIREGLVVPLREIFARLDRYLSADYVLGAQQQRTLDLGPLPVPRSRDVPYGGEVGVAVESIVDRGPRRRRMP